MKSIDEIGKRCLTKNNSGYVYTNRIFVLEALGMFRLGSTATGGTINP
jgi:hypothetical protein